MSTTTEKSNAANLARIRDNQRRSRARRKEYLQELESRLRQCELHGIEASAEIQSAARRVADENKKLRSLLIRHGIAEDSVDAFLRDDGLISGLSWDGGLGGGEAVRILETLLNTKKSCYGDSSTAPITLSQISSTPGASGGSNGAVHWDSGRRQSDNTGLSRTSAQASFLTPASTRSSMSRSHRRSPSLQDQQSHGSLLSSINNRNSVSSHTSPDSQLNSLYDFDDQFGISSVYPPPPQTQSQSQNTRHASNPYVQSRTNGSAMNCNIAADMISAMSGGGHPLDVRTDLGCVSQQDLDCEVDNQVVFSVMDRYSGSGLGL